MKIKQWMVICAIIIFWSVSLVGLQAGFVEKRSSQVNKPPTIVRIPESQTLTIGATVTLRVDAAGTGPLAYQWSKNNVRISGASGPTLTLRNVQESDAGNYTVAVSNRYGTESSTDFRTSSSSEIGYVNGVDVKVPVVGPGDMMTIVMREFEGDSFETAPRRGELQPIRIALGGGSIPPASLAGLQGFTVGEAQIPTISVFAVRQLPAAYAPGATFTVILTATPTSTSRTNRSRTVRLRGGRWERSATTGDTVTKR